MLPSVQSSTSNLIDVQSKSSSAVNSATNLNSSAQKTNAEQSEIVVAPAYSVEISADGQAALRNMSNEGSEKNAAAPQGKPPAGAAPTSTANLLTSSEDDEEDDSTVDSTNLMQYTPAQLAEFVSQGLLSQSAVDKELATRQSSAETKPDTTAAASAEKMMS